MLITTQLTLNFSVSSSLTKIPRTYFYDSLKIDTGIISLTCLFWTKFINMHYLSNEYTALLLSAMNTSYHSL